VVIISGIIHARADEVKQEYEKYFDIIKVEQKGEWQAMSMRKKV
jgi:ribosomal protein L11 methylase PrmA